MLAQVGVVVVSILQAASASDPGEHAQALLHAARDGHASSVTSLIEIGANVDARNEDGLTPLMVAAHRGHLNVVSELLRHGADLHARNRDGVDALLFAIDEGREQVAQYLSRAGARSSGDDEDWLSDASGYDQEPEIVFKPEPPRYPPRAKEARISGEVVVRIRVNRDGTTTVLGVAKPLRYCTLAAIENAKLWTWKPALEDGEPAEVKGIISLNFDVDAEPRR